MRGRQNGGQRAIVDFANVLVYDEALDAADREAIEGYLNDRYFGSLVLGDVNLDGAVNGLDVDPFVAAVVGAGATAVPEPSTLALLAIGVIGLLLGRRR